MNATDAPKAEKPEISEAEKDRRRTLRDLRNLSSVLLVAMGLNIFTLGWASITVGCSLGVFACFGASRLYRGKEVRK